MAEFLKAFLALFVEGLVKYPLAYAIVFIFLVLYFLFAKKRVVKFNGKQETVKGPEMRVYTTENGAGTTWYERGLFISFFGVFKRHLRFGTGISIPIIVLFVCLGVIILLRITHLI